MKRIPKPLQEVLHVGAVLVVTVSLPSCNGIFGGIYDVPEENSEFGFINVEHSTSSGTIYLDATSYTRWNYIDFETFSLDTAAISQDGTETGDVTAGWDFAVHRYDVKTNGGRVMETGYSSFDELLASGSLPQGTYAEDIWTEDRIAVDMSGMMDGVILYVPSWYNQEMSKWINVDTSTMPPVYTLSGKVYVLVTSEGKAAAIRLVNYMDDSKVKGFMTIDYVYPLEFRQ